VLRWHRNLVTRRHARASVNRGPGRPQTLASIRRLVLRLAAENPGWGYRPIHGELALLRITVAPSTVWEILKAEGIDPAPHRATVTWAPFLRSQAQAILAMDFIETVTLSGQRQYILTTIQHANHESECWAPPPTRPTRGSSKRSATWSWTWATPNKPPQ
jgi:hypothetical protein